MVLPFRIDSRWSFVDVVWQLVQHRSTCAGLMEKVLSLCWEIWKNRNIARYGGVQRLGKVRVRTAATLVEEYQVANERECCMNPAVQVKWHPSDSPRFKMNVDGAVFSEQ